MSPTMMRQFWSVLDGMRVSIPLALDDESLEQWLIRQVRSEQALGRREADILTAYIHSRIPLIREMAQEYRAA
ncbi:MAG: hypothetical protein MUF72_19580 [Elainella sp. Prado103]|nr:hypothetical protein [Elainella sp. Prado103]